MKKKKKNKLFNFIFMIFFLSFLVVYFSELAGYYEYKNYKRKELTKEQIEQFESDIASGKQIDLNDYLIVDNKKYNNKLSVLASKLSDGVSNLVESGIESTFKFLSNLVEEN